MPRQAKMSDDAFFNFSLIPTLATSTEKRDTQDEGMENTQPEGMEEMGDERKALLEKLKLQYNIEDDLVQIGGKSWDLPQKSRHKYRQF